MRIAAASIVLVLSAAGTVVAQGTQDSPSRTPLMLEVAARGYLAGGRMGSLAGNSAADKLESYVWADQTLCAMGAGDQAPPNTPWTGWHFTGIVLADVPGQMTVRVEWRRIWENGARISNGASGLQTLVLRSGERVELDRVTPSSRGGCGTVEAKLEAAVMARAAYLVGVPGGVAMGVPGGVPMSGGRGGAAGGRRGGVAPGTAGAASTGGRPGATSDQPTGAPPGVAAGAQGGRGRGGAAGTPMADPYLRVKLVNAGTYDAEVWLVHKKPDGTEVVQQQTLRFGGATKEFAFPPVSIAGSGGPITIDITGSMQALDAQGRGTRYNLFSQLYGARGYAGRGGTGAAAATGSGAGRGAGRGTETSATADKPTADPAPAPLFAVSIARRARRTTPFLDTRGATDVSLQLPKSDDVLSFELPPLQKSTEDLLKGHTFSLRLRIGPVK